MRTPIALLALFVTAAAAQAAPDDPVTLVKQLGDPRYAVREAADRALRRLDEQALGPLLACGDHQSLEVRTRVRSILASLDWSRPSLAGRLRRWARAVVDNRGQPTSGWRAGPAAPSVRHQALARLLAVGEPAAEVLRWVLRPTAELTLEVETPRMVERGARMRLSARVVNIAPDHAWLRRSEAGLPTFTTRQVGFARPRHTIVTDRFGGGAGGTFGGRGGVQTLLARRGRQAVPVGPLTPFCSVPAGSAFAVQERSRQAHGYGALYVRATVPGRPGVTVAVAGLPLGLHLAAVGGTRERRVDIVPPRPRVPQPRGGLALQLTCRAVTTGQLELNLELRCTAAAVLRVWAPDQLGWAPVWFVVVDPARKRGVRWGRVWPHTRRRTVGRARLLALASGGRHRVRTTIAHGLPAGRYQMVAGLGPFDLQGLGGMDGVFAGEATSNAAVLVVPVR